jgi:autotransporter-associated beta strand protein
LKISSPSLRTLFTFVLAAFLVAAAPSFVSAQDPSPTPDPTLDPAYDAEEDWTNTGTDFNTVANWSGSPQRVPNSGDVAWFKVAKVTNPNLSASANIAGLYFQSTTSSGYDITRTSTQTLTLLATAATTTGGTGPLDSAAIAANNTSGTNTIDVPIILGAGGNPTQYFTQASGGTLVINGVISNMGSNGLTLAGGGTFQFTGANTLNSVLTVQAATLSIATINNASVAGVLGNSANAVVLGGSGTTGRLEYTGATASSTKTFTMATGGTGAFQVDTAGTTLTLSGVIGGSGTLLKSGAGTLSLTGANTYTGGTNINGGTLQVASTETAGTSGPLGKSGTISFGGGTLQYSSSNQFDYSGRFSTAASQAFSIDTNAQSVTFATALASSGGSLTKLGAGTLTLSAANTYSGGTTINAGILKMSGSGTLGSTSGSLLMNGGTLDLNGTNQAVGALNGSGGTILNEAPSGGGGPKTLTIGTGNASGSFSGTITDHDGLGSGFVQLIKTGTGTETMTSTTSNYTGGTTINGGTIISNSANGGALGRGPIIVNNTGTLAGAQTIDPAATITVNSGGTLMPGSTASAGSIAKLNTGSLTLNAGSSFAVDLNAGAGPLGTGAGTIYDQVSVTGTITLGGVLTVNPGAGLAIGDKFFIMLNDGTDAVSGGFSNAPTTGSTFAAGSDTFLISYIDNGDNSGLNDISLTVTAVPEPSTWLAGALALVAVSYTQRRRLQRVRVFSWC